MLCGKGGIGWPCGRLAGYMPLFWGGAVRLGCTAPIQQDLKNEPPGVDGLQANEKENPARSGEQPYGPSQRRRWMAKHQRARTQGGTFPACPYCIWTSANSRSRTVRSACRLSWVPYGAGCAPSHAKASRSSESQADGRRIRMSPVRSRRSSSLPAVIGYHCFPPRRVGTRRRFNSRDTAL